MKIEGRSSRSFKVGARDLFRERSILTLSQCSLTRTALIINCTVIRDSSPCLLAAHISLFHDETKSQAFLRAIVQDEHYAGWATASDTQLCGSCHLCLG